MLPMRDTVAGRHVEKATALFMVRPSPNGRKPKDMPYHDPQGRQIGPEGRKIVAGVRQPPEPAHPKNGTPEG